MENNNITTADPFGRIVKIRDVEPGDRLMDHTTRVKTNSIASQDEHGYATHTLTMEDGQTVTLGANSRLAIAVEHGTVAAAMRHRRYKVPMCDACREADRIANTERTRQRRANPANPRIEPDELVAYRSLPTAGAVVVLLDSARWYVVRSADRTPRLMPFPSDNVITIDGARYEAGRELTAHEGDKIAFDNRGDVWKIRLTSAGPVMDKC